MSAQCNNLNSHPTIQTSRSMFIKPGCGAASANPVQLSTVVGYGIALCLYHPQTRCGGMCHYLYPNFQNSLAPSSLFGSRLIPDLIRLVSPVVATDTGLQAHVFGGACQPGNLELIELSDRNIRICHDQLEQYEITIAGFHIGGYKGRKIQMNPQTGHILHTKAENLRSIDWIVMNAPVERAA